MLDIRFSNQPNGRNLDATSELLRQPRLWVPGGDYPDHPDWVDMALSEIAAEQKRSMVAWMGDEQVGVLVYQRHKTSPDTVEIKNLSVQPQARGRRIADFLFRQVELEGPHDFPGATRLVGDTKVTNAAMIQFALHNGMSLVAVPTLEGTFANNGVPDVVLTKQLPVAA